MNVICTELLKVPPFSGALFCLLKKGDFYELEETFYNQAIGTYGTFRGTELRAQLL